jgi:hypothetical protein
MASWLAGRRSAEECCSEVGTGSERWSPAPVVIATRNEVVLCVVLPGMCEAAKGFAIYLIRPAAD